MLHRFLLALALMVAPGLAMAQACTLQASAYAAAPDANTRLAALTCLLREERGHVLATPAGVTGYRMTLGPPTRVTDIRGAARVGIGAATSGCNCNRAAQNFVRGGEMWNVVPDADAGFTLSTELSGTAPSAALAEIAKTLNAVPIAPLSPEGHVEQTLGALLAAPSATAPDTKLITRKCTCPGTARSGFRSPGSTLFEIEDRLTDSQLRILLTTPSGAGTSP
ncbi:hypothetical protein [uncultured Tateyamaria sp.]|uniref:hypothetical protein n=1 Tax=uncultured Tateyamaria sp. TaxID=455651 RepID=UPI00262EDD79|nr:hypothetical protein [uncultured Tateyamaria sp.]